LRLRAKRLDEVRPARGADGGRRQATEIASFGVAFLPVLTPDESAMEKFLPDIRVAISAN
jgi:hypothetical protein